MLKPYLSGLESNLKNRFPDVELLGAFVVLSPRAAMADEDTNIENLDILARKLIPGREEDLKTEWYSFKPHLTGAFKVSKLACFCLPELIHLVLRMVNFIVCSFSKLLKDNSQAEIMQMLASENDEWAELYPLLGKLSAAGLVIPVSSVNCERDFSTMNRVRKIHTSKLFHRCSLDMKKKLWSIKAV